MPPGGARRQAGGGRVESVVIRLSVNVNKIATVRNSRGGRVPSLLEAVRVCIEAGAPGITVHPRADERHITSRDVHDVASFLRTLASPIEFNVEGDPGPEFLALVLAVKPTQCTLVPVRAGELTSQAGWASDTAVAGDDTVAEAAPVAMRGHIRVLREAGVRTSLFVDPDASAIRWAAAMGADRVELYTEPFARAFEAGETSARASLDRYQAAADLAHSLGLGVNAGHDLDLENLPLFRTLRHLDEVSIGHALISHALFVGLSRSVREYLDVLGS